MGRVTSTHASCLLAIMVALGGCSSGSGGTPGSAGGVGSAGSGGGAAGTTARGGSGGGSGVAGSGAAGSGGTGSAGTSGAAGATAQRQTTVRILQGYLRQGVKGSFDIGTRDRDNTWSYLGQSVAYGTLTDYLPVPVTAGNAIYLWFLPPGADPTNYPFTNDNALNFLVPSDYNGRHTLFFSYTDDVTQFSGQLLEDADPALAPPAGYSYVAFNTDALRAQFPTLDYGRVGTCLDRSTQSSYQPVSPGSFAFSIFNGATATGCQGSLVVSSPPTTIGAQEVWMLYAIGDAANGFELRPVKMTRN